MAGVPGEPPIDKLRVFRDLRRDLYGRGYALWETSAGVNELAWARADALAAVQTLAEAGHCIPGGDVWSIGTPGVPRPTYDNWHFEPTGSAEDVAKGRGIATSFIERYEGDPTTTHFTIVWR